MNRDGAQNVLSSVKAGPLHQQTPHPAVLPALQAPPGHSQYLQVEYQKVSLQDNFIAFLLN